MNEAWKIFFEMYFSNGADIFVFVIAPMLWVSSMFIARYKLLADQQDHLLPCYVRTCFYQLACIAAARR